MEKRARNKIAVIGGDTRMLHAAAALSGELDVVLYGISASLPHENIARASDLHSALRGAQSVLLPLPYADAEEQFLRTPLLGLGIGKVPVQCLFSALGRGCLVLGGRFGVRAERLAAERGARLVDYENDDALAAHGAVSTAEGAIMLAMEGSDITIFGANSAVFGFGRCAAAIAERLSALGSRVSVIARSPTQRAAAAERGYIAVDLTDGDAVRAHLAASDYVFNTIPAEVLGREALAALPKSALVIDIASAPGGVDFAAARELGICASLALGLPGRVAARSSGAALADFTLLYANKLL